MRVIKYTNKIENKELGYCLYFDLKKDKEYWYDYTSKQLFNSLNAGDEHLSLIKEDYLFKEY